MPLLSSAFSSQSLWWISRKVFWRIVSGIHSFTMFNSRAKQKVVFNICEEMFLGSRLDFKSCLEVVVTVKGFFRNHCFPANLLIQLGTLKPLPYFPLVSFPTFPKSLCSISMVLSFCAPGQKKPPIFCRISSHLSHCLLFLWDLSILWTQEQSTGNSVFSIQFSQFSM